ncbi:MAG: redoxin family protein [Bacteroidia bacterium]|nr:redoxin family protein [Bacteroidia bacterium]
MNSAFSQNRITDINLFTIKDQPISLSMVNRFKVTAFFFLSPDCPLCENYSVTIGKLRQIFPENQVNFIGIFPGKFYEKMEILAYMAKYHPPVNPLLDPDLTLTCFLGANVTPEVFLVDNTGNLVYQGKIDNWIASLGKHRTVVSQHYLRDALAAFLAGEKIPVSQTEAVGCLIE